MAASSFLLLTSIGSRNCTGWHFHVTSARAVNWMLKDKDSKYQWNILKEEESVDSLNLCLVNRNIRMHEPQVRCTEKFCQRVEALFMQIEYTSEDYHF